MPKPFETWSMSECHAHHHLQGRFSESPWLDTCWLFLLEFMPRLSLLPDDNLHFDNVKTKLPICRARCHVPIGHRGIDIQFTQHGLPFHFLQDRCSWLSKLHGDNG